MKILVVEDEKPIAQFLKESLTLEGFDVHVVFDGPEAIAALETFPPDVIILDLILPSLDGIEVCKRVRRKSTVPILMLTARDQVKDKVEGLEAGADDYLTKPFSFDQLLARIKSLLRRQKASVGDKLTIADLILNVKTHEVRRGKRRIELTSREFTLLEYLMLNRKVVLTREQILSRVWGYDFDPGTNIVDVYVKYLRDKVDKDQSKKLIRTIRNVGYTISEE